MYSTNRNHVERSIDTEKKKRKKKMKKKKKKEKRRKKSVTRERKSVQ